MPIDTDIIQEEEATEEPSAEIFTDEASLVVLEETEDTRGIQHLYGETEIPADPQRIVALHDSNVLVPLYELGEGDRVIASIGGTREDGTTFFRSAETFDTSNVTFLGGYRTYNFELITELEPDLIVGSQFDIPEDNYDLLSQIAPTVIVEQFTRPIWGSVFDIALLVNTQDEVITLKSDYDQRIADIQNALGDPSEITVSVINTCPGDAFVLDRDPFGNDLNVINDIGLSIPPLRQEMLDINEYIPHSFEVLQEADGDVVYLNDCNHEILAGSPLYETLGAVQNGQAFVVESSTFSGISVQGLNGWLDAFEETLLVDDLNRDIIQEEE
jgi:iron complex transport system substrate-binding protein